MEINNQKCSLRIIEWNIKKNKKILEGILNNINNISKNNSHLFENIEGLDDDIQSEKPDIVVLTECGKLSEKIKGIIEDINNKNTDSISLEYDKSNKQSKWKIFLSNEDNYNFIAILVNNEKIETVKTVPLLDFQKDFCEDNERAKIHPNRIAVNITLNNTDITILGVRLLTGWPDKGIQKIINRIFQNIKLIYNIQNLKPDIIIGDFNTYSEMHASGIYDENELKNNLSKVTDKQKTGKLPPIINLWNELIKPISEETDKWVLDNFCTLISQKTGKSYECWPPKDGFISCCFGTSPDTIIWNTKKFEENKINRTFHPKIDNEQVKVETDGKQESDKPKINWPSNWPSDHCMLIADIEF